MATKTYKQDIEFLQEYSYFNEVFPFIEQLIVSAKKYINLSDYLYFQTEQILNYLEIKRNLFRSSKLKNINFTSDKFLNNKNSMYKI